MKKAVIIALIIILGGALFYYIHLYEPGDLAFLTEEQAAEEVPDKVKTNKEVVTPVKNDDSPEISNNEYMWLRQIVDVCYPEYENDLKQALASDNMITKKENMVLLDRCIKWNEQKHAGEKEAIRNM